MVTNHVLLDAGFLKNLKQSEINDEAFMYLHALENIAKEDLQDAIIIDDTLHGGFFICKNCGIYLKKLVSNAFATEQEAKDFLNMQKGIFTDNA